MTRMTREQRAGERLLQDAGFEFVRMGKGSHRYYRHPNGATTTLGLRIKLPVVEAIARRIKASS